MTQHTFYDNNMTKSMNVNALHVKVGYSTSTVKSACALLAPSGITVLPIFTLSASPFIDFVPS